MNIAVCDDEKIYLDMFRQTLSDLFIGDSVRYYNDIESLKADMNGGHNVSLLFLDIELSAERNGIDYAEEFAALYPDMQIIYMTSYNEKFVQEIFLHSSNLIGYLAKPVRRDIARALLEKAKTRGADDVRVAVRTAGEIVMLRTDDILYIESTGHLLELYTDKTVYRVWEKLSEYLGTLPDCFVQCHKSYAVNLRRVDRVKNLLVYLDDGRTVPVSRSKSGVFTAGFFEFTEKAVKNG